MIPTARGFQNYCDAEHDIGLKANDSSATVAARNTERLNLAIEAMRLGENYRFQDGRSGPILYPIQFSAKEFFFAGTIQASTERDQARLYGAAWRFDPGGLGGSVIDGQEELATIPWTSATDIGRSAFGVTAGTDGLVLDTAIPTFRNQLVENYQGIGIHTDAQDGRIFDCISRHNHIGAKLGTSDSEISRCRLYNNRDACLWIAAGAGSANCQSTQNHCYAARIACYNEGSQAYRAVNDTYADSLIGYFGDDNVSGSHQATLTNVFFQHNMVCDCLFTCTGNHLVNCIVNVQKAVTSTDVNAIDIPDVITRSTVTDNKVGVELASRCTIRGGVIELVDWVHDAHTASGVPCECVRIADGSERNVIETEFLDSQEIDGAIGIRVMGACSGLKVDCMTGGFHDTNSRLLVIDDAANADGLDVTFHINGMTKPLSGYISTGAGWTGSIRTIDVTTGVETVLPEGDAT